MLVVEKLASQTRKRLKMDFLFVKHQIMTTATHQDLKSQIIVSKSNSLQYFTHTFHRIILGITFNRGCCRIGENSPVCPPGPEITITENENPPYKKITTRCSGDLCNDGLGDGSPDF